MRNSPLFASRLRVLCGIGPSIGRCLKVPASGTIRKPIRRRLLGNRPARLQCAGATDCFLEESGVRRDRAPTRLRGCRWLKNCSVAARQVNSRERASASARSSFSASRQAVRRSSCSTPAFEVADDIARAGHRIRGHRQPAGHGLEQHQAEGVGLARETRTRRRRRTPWPVPRGRASRDSSPAEIARGCVRAPDPCPPPTSIPAGRARGTPRRSSPRPRVPRTGRSAARC